MNRHLLLSVTAFGCLLAGCVPYVGSYYEPAATGGTPFRDMCHSGPLSNIEIPRSPIKVLIHSRFEPHSDRGYSIDLELGLHPNDLGTVDWSGVKVRALDGTALQVTTESYEYNLPSTSFDPHRRIDSAVVDGHVFVGYEYIVFIHSQMPDTFIYTMPQMTIDGVSYPSMDITFQRKSGLRIIPLNC